MYIADIFDDEQKLGSGQLFQIRNGCSEFLRESQGYPVYKQLSSTHGTFARIKVRHKPNPIIEQYFFAEVLNHTKGGKALVETTSQPTHQNHAYWIFPTDGYKYLFNPAIKDYKSSIKNIIEQTSDDQIISELVADQYKSTDLIEALQTDTEILWFKISHFYAVDCSLFQDYSELLKNL